MMTNSIKNAKAQKLLLDEMMNHYNICEHHFIKSYFTDDSGDLMVGTGYFGYRTDKENFMLDETKFKRYSLFDVVNMDNTSDLVFAGSFNKYIYGEKKLTNVYCFVTSDTGIAKHYFEKRYMDIFNMEYVEYHYKKGICIITDANTHEIIVYVLEIMKVGEKNDQR